MSINESIIEYVAKLSKLELSETEKKAREKDLKDILNYMEILNEIDTTEIVPMSHTFDTVNVMREDIVKNDYSRDELLSNAPQKKGGYFIVPKTVE